MSNENYSFTLNSKAMKKYNGKSVRNVKTDTGKLPDNMGFPGNMKGVTRKLVKSDHAQMKRNGIAPYFTANML